jgi:O-antigen/teichoic acid export membrane protein
LFTTRNTLTIDESTTIRNSGIFLFLRLVEAGTGFLIAFVIPRLMGPEIYGHYVLIASLSLLFMLASTLGFMPVLGRYVPQFVKTGDQHSLHLFFSNLFVIRTLSATLCGIGFLLLTTTWLKDIDPLILQLAAVAMVCRSLSHFTFNLFLGLDQANRWGIGDIIRRFLSLVLVALGFWLGDLQGAMFAWLVIEVFVLGLGIWWVRDNFTQPDLFQHPHAMAPYLRFGLVFFASNLLLSAFERSGEALVRMISHDYVQVGYFGLAYNIYLAVGIALPEFALAFAPWLTMRKLDGQHTVIRLWTERLLKWMTIGSIVIIFATLLLANDIVPVILGKEYLPVAEYLVPLTFALLAVVLGSVARLLSLVIEQPRNVLLATIMELAVFWAVAVPLISWKGGIGATMAFFAASMVYGGYMTYRLQKETAYSLRSWSAVILTAAVFLPLIWLRAGIWVNLALFTGFLLCYGALLVTFKLVSKDEAVTIWQAFVATRRVLSPENNEDKLDK